MATQARKGQGKRQRPLTYLYLNGDLHRVLHINRSQDIITMWSYPQDKRVGYTYSDVKARMEKAFTTAEVMKMLNRTRLVLERAILDGDIEAPQYTYNLETKKKYKYMWHEKDIMAMHSVLKTRHMGWKRKDGLINVKSLPSAREVLAMIRHDAILYVKTDDGRFVPTWEAEHF